MAGENNKKLLIEQAKMQRELLGIIREKKQAEQDYKNDIQNGILKTKEQRLEQAKNNKTLKETQQLNIKIVEQVKKTKDKLKEIGDAVAKDIQGPFDKLKGTMESLPFGGILSKMGDWEGKQKNLTNELQKTFKYGDIGVKNLAKGFGQVTSASGKMLATLVGPVGMVALIGALAISAWNFSKAAGESAKKLGIGITQMKALNVQASALGLTHEQSVDAISALSGETNGLIVTNEDLVKSTSELAFNYGISEDTSARLNTIAIGYGSTLKDVETTVGASVQNFTKLGVKGLSFQQIMKEVSEVSASTRANYKGGLSELTNSVIQAKLMGTTLDKIASQSRQSLDIESSIAKEMEARVLLGKNISLDALRHATLSGDGVQMQQEQMKIMSQMGDFSKMDVITREKSADLLGLSVDEAMKMQENQKVLNSLGMAGKDLSEMDFDAMVKKSKNLTGQAKINAELFIQQQQNVSEAAKWEHSMHTLKESFGPIMASLLPIVDVFSSIVSYVGQLVGKFNSLGKDSEGFKKTIIDIAKVAATIGGAALAFKGVKGILGKFGIGKGGKKDGSSASSALFVQDINGSGSGSGDMTDMLKGGKRGWMQKLGKGLFKNVSKVFGGKKTAIGRMMRNVAAKAGGGGFGKASTVLSKAGKSFSTSSGAGKAIMAAKNGASGAAKGGGFLSRMAKGASGLASRATGAVGRGVGAVGGQLAKMNPLKALNGLFKGPVGKLFGKALGPIMGAVSGFMDINSVIGDAKAQQKEGKAVDFGSAGKKIVQAGAYPIANFALNAANIVPGLGTALSIGDGLLSTMGMSPIKWMTDNLIDLVPNSAFKGLGKFAVGGPKLADGGMITKEINNATIGEAGAEAVVPLDKFYEKLDELKKAINQLGQRPILVKIGNNQAQQVVSDGGYLNKTGNGIGLG